MRPVEIRLYRSVLAFGDRRHLHGEHHQLHSREGTTPAKRSMGHSALAGESGFP